MVPNPEAKRRKKSLADDILAALEENDSGATTQDSLVPPQANVGPQGGISPAKADLRQAIATAEVSKEKTEYEEALGEAYEKIAAGTPLSEAVTDFLAKVGADAAGEKEVADKMRSLEASIRDLKATLSSPDVTDDERIAIIQALSQPSALVQIPDTDATRKAVDILKSINQKIGEVKAPPKVRGYGAGMLLRPGGEIAGAGLEGGLSSLIAASVLAVVGVTVAPHSLGHLLTYLASAGGWNFGTNMVTKALVLQGVADEGSVSKGIVRGLFKDRHGKVSAPRLVASAPLRLASIGLLIAGGVAVAQQVLGRTDESSRSAALLAAPLRAQEGRVTEFQERMRAFAPIVPRILEIASKIESGKPRGSAAVVPAPQPAPKAKGTKGQQPPQTTPQPARATGAWEAYGTAEIATMKEPLVKLFEAAGLSGDLARAMNFNQPASLGEGPAFEFKVALRTGDTSKLKPLTAKDKNALMAAFSITGTPSEAELVAAIRLKMGLSQGDTFESKISSYVSEFLKSKELAQIAVNLTDALRVEAAIRKQGESAARTFKEAFLEGVPPVGVEAVRPYIDAIIAKKDEVKNLASEKVGKPVNDMFATMSKALAQVGGSVSAVEFPEQQIDVTPLQELSNIITKIVEAAASSAATEAATKSSIRGVLSSLVPGLPGSEKARGAERYVSGMRLQMDGYRIAKRGPQTIIYERIGGDSKEGFSAAAAENWSKYIFGEAGRKTVEESFPKVSLEQIGTMSDAEVGKEIRPHIGAARAALAARLGMQPADKTLKRGLTNYESMERLDDDGLGKLVRAQVGIQFGAQRAPIVYPASIWDKLKSGTNAPEAGIDPKVWAMEVAAADPDFGRSILSELSGMDNKKLGALVRDHVRKVVAALESKQKASGTDLSYMIAQYRGMEISDDGLLSLGAEARKQLAHQMEHKMSPLTVYPKGVWAVVLDPSLAETSTDIIDPAAWKQLPQDEADKLFARYMESSKWHTAALTAGPVILLSLLTFIVSLFAVARKNKKLLRTKDGFIENWHNVEKDILIALSDLNTALSQLPFFSSLPKMDPYMLLAALRKLGEEYSDDLKEGQTLLEELRGVGSVGEVVGTVGGRIGHHLKAAVAKGPYAEPILEIFAMEKLLDRLQKDPEAFRTLTDIIAPGLMDFAELSNKLNLGPTGNATPIDAAMGTMNMLDLSGRELLRDSARGHLRFREAIAESRIALNERAQERVVASPAFSALRQAFETPVPFGEVTEKLKEAEGAEAILGTLVAIQAESETWDAQDMMYAALIERLDTDALAETMLKRYKTPGKLTPTERRRGVISRRAESAISVTLPRKGDPLREFSLPAALAADGEGVLKSPAGKSIDELLITYVKSSQAVFDEYANRNPGSTARPTIAISQDGDVVITIEKRDSSGNLTIEECPARLIYDGFSSPFSGAAGFRSFAINALA